MSEKKTSPWVWVGVGCGGLALLVLVTLGGLALLGFRWAKGLEASLTDPVARADRVKEVLGAEELPPGYHAMFVMSVPFLLDLAVLSDREPDAEGRIEDFGEHGFIYVRTKRSLSDKDDREMREFIEGKRRGLSFLQNSNIDFDRDELIATGRIETDDPLVLYGVHRGSLEMDRHEVEGLVTLMILDCPDDPNDRLGFWFSRAEPDENVPVEELDLTGTTGDEAEIRDFLGHFRICES